MRKEPYLFLLNKKRLPGVWCPPLRKKEGRHGWFRIFQGGRTSRHPCGGAAACVPPPWIVTVGARLFSVFAPPPK